MVELLNNCIAHQDYIVGNRIYINEFDDKIKFTNPGSFLPQSIQPVLKPSYSPPYYRNQLLADVMRYFYMIDTATMGIRKVFKIQREKFFPMPDYDFSRHNEVAVTVYGKIINENYTRVLYDNPDFDLNTVYLIDRIQKNAAISNEEIKELRKLGVIEGKKPNIYVSASVAKSIDEKAQYIKNKGFDDAYYKNMIIDYLKKFGKANKDDIRKLIFDKLPAILTSKQKENKVRNILYSMHIAKLIDRDGSNTKASNWHLTK